MTLLFVASNNRGTIAPFISEQAELLRARGHEVRVFGVEGHGVRGYLHNLNALRAEVRSLHPDVVHAHYGLCGLLAGLACRRVHVPLVVTYHGSDINEPSVRRFSKAAMRLASRNVFISRKTMELALGSASESLCSKATLLPCGINLEDYPFISKEEARARLCLKPDGRYVLFAGAFDNEVKCSQLAKEALALMPGVELLELKGYDREGVCNVMSASDAFLMTSRSEGSPQVIKETLAVGLPIVSVDVGDVKERLEGLPHARICPREAPSLAAALREVMEAGASRSRLRELGRERLVSSGLSNDQVAERLIEIYEPLCRKVVVKPLSSCGDSPEWRELLRDNPTASWFQSPEALEFFGSLSFLTPFAFGVYESGALKGVMAGFIQKDGGPLKSFLSRRAIVNGGPLLAVDISPETLGALLRGVAKDLRHRAIFIETRNYQDYSAYRDTFRDAGWVYDPHCNFHIDTSSVETVDANLGRGRRREVKLSIANGVEVDENPTLQDVKDFYAILSDLYKTKIKTPLYPFSFFESLFETTFGQYIMIKHEGRVLGGALNILSGNGVVYAWFLCGDNTAVKHVYPSTMADYASMLYAARNGYHRYDMMGAGKPDEEYGVRKFKAEFGGTLVEHGRFRRVSSPLLYSIGTLGVRILKGELFKTKKKS